MYKINVKVELNTVNIISKTISITTNSLNSIKCLFDLPDEFENLNCVAIFTAYGKNYREMITDNECIIPKDALQEGEVELGVYAFKGNDLIYSPEPTYFTVKKGSYTTEESSEETENTQNAFDKWVEEANTLYLKIESKDTELDTKISEIEEKLANGDFKGEKGDQGLPGMPGQKGEPGEAGPQGEKGEQGEAGKSAYQIAVQNGFEGTEQEWLESLKNKEYIDSVVGNIDTILDNVNGEVV